MQEFMNENGNEPVIKCTKLDRLAKQHWTLALENGMQTGLELKFSMFTVPEKLVPLQPWEHMYSMEPDAEGPLKPIDDPPGRTRCCVCDTRTNESTFLVPVELGPDSKIFERSVHASSDDGPIGRPATHHLFEKLPIRGRRDRDRARKQANIAKNAAVESGCYIVCLETTCGFNLLGGPHDGAAFFYDIQSNAQARI